MNAFVILGAILTNNHQKEFYDEFNSLIKELNKEDLLKWKVMNCLEVATVVLAEVLIQNGVNIDVDTEMIHWPMADIVPGPPTNVVNKGKAKGSKVSKKVISGKSAHVFGQIVNDIQANKATSSNPVPETSAGLSTSGTVAPAATSTTNTTSEQPALNKAAVTSNVKGAGAQMNHHAGLPARVRAGN